MLNGSLYPPPKPHFFFPSPTLRMKAHSYQMIPIMSMVTRNSVTSFIRDMAHEWRIYRPGDPKLIVKTPTYEK